MATIKTDVLQPFEYKGTNFKYYRSNFDKIEFVTQQKRPLKTKTLVSPELSFNPQYNAIHQTIADSNLAIDIKEGYENINYHPITSTGYRGFSGLNSRNNGIKQTFAVKEKSELMCAYDKDCQNKNCIYPHSTISQAVRETSSSNSPILKEVLNQDFGAEIFEAMMKDKKFKGTKINTKVAKKESPEASPGTQIFDALIKDKQKSPGTEIFETIMKNKKGK
jgi:hypothetical protein